MNFFIITKLYKMQSNEIFKENIFKLIEQTFQTSGKDYKDTEYYANKTCEIFYQNYLETKKSGSHLKNQFGVTDVETDNEIIEIKDWNNYKSALGQILFYSFNSEKHKSVYFFGNKPRIYTHIVSVFKKYNINVYHLSIQNNKVVEELLNEFNDDFILFLNKHIIYKQNSLFQIKDALVPYLNISDIEFHNYHSTFLKKYKIKIEKFIKNKFPNLKSDYGTVSIDAKTYKGWKHIIFQ